MSLYGALFPETVETQSLTPVSPRIEGYGLAADLASLVALQRASAAGTLVLGAADTLLEALAGLTPPQP
ncbi:hypothetical protein [Pararhodospirillum photometricum]|uniref:Uncharacterized protein n=1 Tax=Pararhodospirillum photometricum DSM 122 TaxID=1150469 RepID=H6SIP5_PARPM|nr:hypothetical protein [Pararhodospirillum photometricum]CCG06672.1 unnamed protein product [Pararhodospirillum photometricum DSM 122]